MTRREVMLLFRNIYISFLIGGVLKGCDFLKGQKEDIPPLTPQLAFLLGYLLYGDELSPSRVEEMKTHVETVVQSSLRKKEELEALCNRIAQKNSNSSFETLSPAKKEVFFKDIMPLLQQSSGVQEILKHYLEGDRVLQFLDYPDLPGDFGECNWLVLEGEVWDKYYPPSS
jgi:hypothetical protein